ncbi:hypothetical protein O9993_12310 [Vibrio lentus]|nr:hypothetical protein [Vibrio lentus]
MMIEDHPRPMANPRDCIAQAVFRRNLIEQEPHHADSCAEKIGRPIASLWSSRRSRVGEVSEVMEITTARASSMLEQARGWS